MPASPRRSRNCAIASGLWLGRPPHPRALREHLHAVAADRLDAVDGGVNPAAAEETCAPNSTRPYDRDECLEMSASAWPRARPASFISEAFAPSSSTGFTRASTAARSCCGSRTPTRAVRLRGGRPDQGVPDLARDRLGRGGASSSTPRTRARELAERLVAEGNAYEDDGAIRFRQPKEGTVSWDDAVRGRIEFKNELLPDTVIVRSDGRPTYNFISPVDDVVDEISHVIRGDDHVSNTPTQINILRALGADLPMYAHLPNINGDDGRKLSKRRNAVALDDFRASRLPPGGALQLPRAARLELRRQDDDHVAARAGRALRPRPCRARARRRSTTRSSTG